MTLNIDTLENQDWPKRTDDHHPFVALARNGHVAHLYLAPWRPELHPKWPKGTPGRTRTGHPLGGKFMETTDIAEIAKRTITGWLDVSFLTRGSHTIDRVQARGTPDGGAEFKVTTHDGVHRVAIAPHTRFEQVVGALDHIDRGEREPEPAASAGAPQPPAAEDGKVVRLADVPDLKIVRIDGVSYRKMPTHRSDGRIRLTPVEGRGDKHYAGTKMVIIAAPVPPPPPPERFEQLQNLAVGQVFEMEGERWFLVSKGRSDGRFTIRTRRQLPDDPGRVETVTRHLSSRRVKLVEGDTPPPPITPPVRPPPPGPEWTGAFEPKSIKDIEPGTKVTLLGGIAATVKSSTDRYISDEQPNKWGVVLLADGRDESYNHDRPVFPRTDPNSQMQNRKYLGAIPVGYVVQIADGRDYRIMGPAVKGDSQTDGLQDWILPLVNVETGEVVTRDAKVLVHVGPQHQFREGPQRLDQVPEGSEVFLNGEKVRVYRHNIGGNRDGETDLIRVDPSEETIRIEGRDLHRTGDVIVWGKQPAVGEGGQIGSLPAGAFVRITNHGVMAPYEVRRHRINNGVPETLLRRADGEYEPDWWGGTYHAERIDPPPPPITDKVFRGTLAERFEVGQHAFYDGFEWEVKEKGKRGILLVSADGSGATKTHFVGRATPLGLKDTDEAGKRHTPDQLLAQAKRIADGKGLNTEEQFRALGSLVRRAVVAGDPLSSEAAIAIEKHRQASLDFHSSSAEIKALKDGATYLGYSSSGHVPGPLEEDYRRFANADALARYQAAKALHTQASRDLSTYGPRATEARKQVYATSRERVLAALGKVREMGGPLEMRFADASPSNPIRKITEQTPKFLPADWIAHQGRPLEVYVSRGHIRAYYQFGSIHLSGSTYGESSTPLHEVSHHWEYRIEGMDKLTKAFRIGRAPGEVAHWLGENYKHDEKAVRDEFFSAYMGKDYGSWGQSSEVFTMGMEDLFFRGARAARTDAPAVPKGNYDLLVDDPDYADFILGLLAALPPAGTNPPSVSTPYVPREPISSRRTKVDRLKNGKSIKLSPSEEGYWTVMGLQADGTVLLKKYRGQGLGFEEQRISRATLVYTRPTRR